MQMHIWSFREYIFTMQSGTDARETIKHYDTLPVYQLTFYMLFITLCFPWSLNLLFRCHVGIEYHLISFYILYEILWWNKFYYILHKILSVESKVISRKVLKISLIRCCFMKTFICWSSKISKKINIFKTLKI